MSNQTQIEKESAILESEDQIDPKKEKAVPKEEGKKVPKGDSKEQLKWWGYCDDTSGGPHSFVGF